MTQPKRIGIYDSGIGGLTVLKPLIKHLDATEIHYIGDTQNAPYGDKSKEELWQINQHLLTHLKDKNIDTLIIACNTSCALFINDIQSQVPFPVYGLITPTAAYALNKSPNKRIAVLATSRTIQSQQYQNAILAENPNAKILEIACPKLVPIIEAGEIKHPKHQDTLLSYLNEVKDFNPDSIIYGCSHYPFLEEIWKAHAPQYTYINPGNAIANSLPNSKPSPSPNTPNKNITFYVSGPAEIFKLYVRNYLSIDSPIIKPLSPQAQPHQIS